MLALPVQLAAPARRAPMTKPNSSTPQDLRSRVLFILYALGSMAALATVIALIERAAA